MDDLLASVITEPLEVVNVVLAVSGLAGGVAGAAELARGGGARQIADEAARGAAAGFLLGTYAGIAAALIIALT